MKKLLWILPMMLLMSIIAVMAAPYNISIHTPSASQRPNGIYKFQLNISVDSGVNDILNTSFAIDSTTVCWNNTAVTNATGQILISCSYNTATGAYNDTSTHDVTATIYPIITAAANNGTATRSGVTFDNTIPNTPTLTSPAAGAKMKKAQTFTGTVVSGNTSSCQLLVSYDNGQTYTASNTYTMTKSGTTCSYTISKGSPPDGAVTWKIRASDGLNTTDATGRAAIIDTSTSNGVAAETINVGIEAGNEQAGRPDTIQIILVLGVLVGVYYFFLKGKK